jgi:molybdenum cofactor guanylyltransferase
MEHKKHEKLALRERGNFHPNEIGIVGTNCDYIKDFSSNLIKELSPILKAFYVDAIHQKNESAYHFGLLDKMDHWQLIAKERPSLHEADWVFMNSNHFEARYQIVFIDPDKRESVRKRIAQITHPLFFVLRKGETRIFDFLENFRDVPVFREGEFEEIVEVIIAFIQSKIPHIHGVVLAGGESRRMGRDKGLLEIHGKPQREWMLDLLRPLCKKVFLSAKSEIANFRDNVIIDTFTGLGPMGAILSAFRYNPNVAWLVVATDLPLIDEGTIKQLISSRNPYAHCTAFMSPEKQFPEPLIAIYEPKAYRILLNALSDGVSCPRKAMKGSFIESIDALNPEKLVNVNDPLALEEAIKKLN